MITRSVPPSVPTSLDLERDRRAVARARAFVRDHCAQSQVAETVCDTAVLLVSELVTNAVEHARSRVRLAVAVSARLVHVEVGDQNAALPAVRSPDSSAVHGRGMAIVDGLAEDWGVRPDGRGKTIWFDLPR
ncbi:ATP-binding protein [Kineococcus sp. TBRC 1896]|uniref:ATP-binding protein n=1 Tax=Kineococcus mangrovi TaxID=1660183 RepID=A0ABV4I634_9ACTN